MINHLPEVKKTHRHRKVLEVLIIILSITSLSQIRDSTQVCPRGSSAGTYKSKDHQSNIVLVEQRKFLAFPSRLFHVFYACNSCTHTRLLHDKTLASLLLLFHNPQHRRYETIQSNFVDTFSQAVFSFSIIRSNPKGFELKPEVLVVSSLTK